MGAPRPAPRQVPLRPRPAEPPAWRTCRSVSAPSPSSPRSFLTVDPKVQPARHRGADGSFSAWGRTRPHSVTPAALRAVACDPAKVIPTSQGQGPSHGHWLGNKATNFFSDVLYLCHLIPLTAFLENITIDERLPSRANRVDRAAPTRAQPPRGFWSPHVALSRRPWRARGPSQLVPAGPPH